MPVRQALHAVSRGHFISKKTGIPWTTQYHNHKYIAETHHQASCLIGSSICGGFENYPQIWKNNFKGWLNQGIGGDRAQHILWRVLNNSLPQNAKNVIIIAGGNNLNNDPPTEIADAVINIAQSAQSKCQMARPKKIICVVPVTRPTRFNL